MVTRRARQRPLDGLTAYERGLQALQSVPISDEDPRIFWGADVSETIRRADADVAAGRTEYFDNTESFRASLRIVESDG